MKRASERMGGLSTKKGSCLRASQGCPGTVFRSDWQGIADYSAGTLAFTFSGLAIHSFPFSIAFQ